MVKNDLQNGGAYRPDSATNPLQTKVLPEGAIRFRHGLPTYQGRAAHEIQEVHMRKTVKKSACARTSAQPGCSAGFRLCGGGALKLKTGLAGDENFHQDRPYALDADQVAPTRAEFKRAEEYLTQNILESAESGSPGL